MATKERPRAWGVATPAKVDDRRKVCALRQRARSAMEFDDNSSLLLLATLLV
jgi:hypothetical protein